MKQLFKSELNGLVLFKKAIMFLIAYGVCIIGMVTMLNNEFYLGYFLVLILMMISGFALQFQFMSEFINAVSLDDKKFEFVGTFGSFMAMCLKGIALTLVTFGIYGSWFQKKFIDYISTNTNYPDKEITFNGEGGTLFKYILLSFAVPCIVLGTFLAFVFPNVFSPDSLMMTGNITPDYLSSLGLFFIVYIGGVILISAIYTFYSYKWLISFYFGDETLTLETTVSKATIFYIKQGLLTVVTLGIYAFAAQIKIFAFFVNNSKLTNRATLEETDIKFVGVTSQGFGILLGQTILCIVTLGIYYPWAYANIQNWLISNIEIGE